MYGDNKANVTIMDLNDVRRLSSTLDNSIRVDCKVGYSAQDVLALAELSQIVTNMLNDLYEQMKGE